MTLSEIIASVPENQRPIMSLLAPTVLAMPLAEQQAWAATMLSDSSAGIGILLSNINQYQNEILQAFGPEMSLSVAMMLSYLAGTVQHAASVEP